MAILGQKRPFWEISPKFWEAISLATERIESPDLHRIGGFPGIESEFGPFEAQFQRKMTTSQSKKPGILQSSFSSVSPHAAPPFFPADATVRVLDRFPPSHIFEQWLHAVQLWEGFTGDKITSAPAVPPAPLTMYKRQIATRKRARTTTQWIAR